MVVWYLLMLQEEEHRKHFCLICYYPKKTGQIGHPIHLLHNTPQRITTHPSVSQHTPACHNTPQRVTTHSSVSQLTPAYHNTPQRITTHPSVSQLTPAYHNSPQRITTHPSVSQLTPACHNSPQRVTTHLSVSQHTPACHNTLQRITTHPSVSQHTPAYHGLTSATASSGTAASPLKIGWLVILVFSYEFIWMAYEQRLKMWLVYFFTILSYSCGTNPQCCTGEVSKL